eukprot:TRINITY_DN7272_c0_g1_i1.p1 TRINITY_DN7272_c0_g1~~TRINITY_DN7272_c0_g1_i1.p1  ORF type:complete len:326 (+),score=69.01 TRINITY_DN7272_c0_g1_i1:51-980(+)
METVLDDDIQSQLTASEVEALATVRSMLTPEWLDKHPIFVQVFSAQPSTFDIVRFLIPKKLNPVDTLSVMDTYSVLRSELGAWTLNDPTVKEFLLSHLSMINPAARTKKGRGLIFVKPSNMPSKFESDWKTQAKMTLLLLEVLARDLASLRCGIAVVVDMRDAPFTLNAGQGKFLRALVSNAPARIKAVYILRSPWYLAPLLKFASVFVKKKIMDRIRTIKWKQLCRDVLDPDSVPVHIHEKAKSKFSVGAWLSTFAPSTPDQPLQKIEAASSEPAAIPLRKSGHHSRTHTAKPKTSRKHPKIKLHKSK